MKQADHILYMEEHYRCENYNKSGSGSMVDTVALKKGENYERSLTVPEIVFVYRGKIEVSFRDIYGEILHRGKISLLPPGESVQMSVQEDSYLLICRLHRELSLCNLVSFEKLADYKKEGGTRFNSLKINNSIAQFLDGFVPHLERNLRCRHYLELKIRELMYLLRAYYTKEDLAAFFYLLAGSDFEFRNRVYTTVSGISSVEQWASMNHLSRDAFRKKFSRIMGKSPSAFLIEEKCMLIRRELEHGSRPPKIIAEMLGFSSVIVFQAFCKKHLGDSPGHIRRAALLKK